MTNFLDHGANSNKTKNNKNKNKWEGSTNRKMRKTSFDELSKYFFGETSYEKYQKAKNVEQSILMNAQNIWMIPFLFKENVLLSPILKALLSNKNGILHFWKNQ